MMKPQKDSCFLKIIIFLHHSKPDFFQPRLRWQFILAKAKLNVVLVFFLVLL